MTIIFKKKQKNRPTLTGKTAASLTLNTNTMKNYLFRLISQIINIKSAPTPIHIRVC